MSAVPPFSLETPRYDQSTFYGRWKHFSGLVNPKMLLVTETDLNKSKALLERFSQGKIPKNEVSDEELWNARQIKESLVHPQTGEIIPLPCRLSAFVPANIPICAGMILAPPTLFNTLFWQWANQSYNAAFNYANRNASSDQENSAIMKAYACATVVSGATAVGLGKAVEKLHNVPKPILRGLQKAVPFIAVACAGTFNAVSMRLNELNEGIDVMDNEGNVHGISHAAAKKALTEVALTRVALPMPILLLPPYILEAMSKVNMMPKNRFGKVAAELTVITMCLWGALPAAVALFPQTGSVDASELEEKFHFLKNKDGTNISTLYYNKGI